MTQHSRVCLIPHRYQLVHNPMGQKHRCLAERHQYYGIMYSTVGYMIFWFLMCTLQCYPPPNLQIYFNGCGTTFEVRHALSCNKVGLGIARHN